MGSYSERAVAVARRATHASHSEATTETHRLHNSGSQTLFGSQCLVFETLFPSLARREVADFAITSERRKQSFKRADVPKLEFGNEKEEASKE
jgi:3'-phosphoadenosine 5'-phosphosulfate sulfotransferase (PAPS reductase)/FAD synthetase